MSILLLILTVLCIVVVIKTNEEYDISVQCAIGIIGIGVFTIANIVCLSIAIETFVKGIPAERKIEMYKKENTKIEKDIDLLVKQYMEYEGKTLNNFKKESSITLVNLYPDLKTNELVKQQIDIHTQNNNKIKELNELTINMSIGKWLLYFGS